MAEAGQSEVHPLLWCTCMAEAETGAIRSYFSTLHRLPSLSAGRTPSQLAYSPQQAGGSLLLYLALMNHAVNLRVQTSL